MSLIPTVARNATVVPRVTQTWTVQFGELHDQLRLNEMW